MTGAALRLGILTPSSNTALEPLSSAVVAGLPDVSLHFSRFPVTEIALSEGARRQFDPTPVLVAARLLADARVDVIGWSGTSASWLGFDQDRALCARIAEETGRPATTSVLALNELLECSGTEEFALFTPYTHDVQARIVANYATAGWRCSAETHLGIRSNFDFALVEPAAIERECRRLLEMSGATTMVTLCTNLRSAHLATVIERDTNALLLDSVSTVLWKMLVLGGRDPAGIRGFGRMFTLRGA